MIDTDLLKISDKSFRSRLFVGTGKFASAEQMQASIAASRSELVTVAMKRVNTHDDRSLFQSIKDLDCSFLPNTSGVRTAKEAIFAAELAREAFETNWLKLEIHPDPKYLLPDPIETLIACEELAKRGFVILPYIHADPVLCKRLEDAGTSAVMPLGAPIGSNRGLITHDFLKIIIEQARVPVVVDAGIGAPSHATYAMELGADAVLVNTAIAVSPNPTQMAEAFASAVEVGRKAYLAGLGSQQIRAVASSPLTSFLD